MSHLKETKPSMVKLLYQLMYDTSKILDQGGNDFHLKIRESIST